MPTSQQAKKRIRQDTVRRLRNRARKTQIKTYARKITSAIAAGDLPTAEAAFCIFQKKIDKAARHRTIHPNAAARRKSRMMSQLNKAKQAS